MDLAAWLRNLGLERYEPAFRDSEISADVLPDLTDADLRELGLPLGPRKVLLKAIASLRPRPSAGGGVDADAAPELADASRDRPRPAGERAERRQLTVMFADLAGSTALSTRLDPEEMRAVLHAYQNAITDEIARVGGHVAKLMGDGVLAYFGWPRAHEDDPERAVRAGLAAAGAVSQLSAPGGEPLTARIGIATGLVVVGDLVAVGGAREEEVIGETPNLAARLQETAEPGTVVIADGTRGFLGELFDLRARGATLLKGFARPVECFQILREHPTISRFEARRSGGSLPMVGREQELALVLDRWQEAVAGEGQAALLIGEPGIGKSRLVQAILDATAEGETLAVRYQCSPHHTGTALWPIIQQLGLAAGLESTDVETDKLDKLEALLKQAGEDSVGALPLIAALLGIDVEACDPVRGLTPHQRRARTLTVLVGQLLGLARLRPVLMVVEDAHWIDPTTAELLVQALDGIAKARVLMLITSRPDDEPGLGRHPHVTRLRLNRLGRSPTRAIVANLTCGVSLAPYIVEEISAHADGVPLFVEELTKAVLEAEKAGSRAAVPVSLQASLIARLDRVPGTKEVAQAAACIGREFAYPLLAKVCALPGPELKRALDGLVAAELVFGRGAPPEARYTFKHALVRDAAHESLLKAYRQKLHARIVQVLEESFPETTDAEPELLARHCVEAGRIGRALDYWQQAGQQALARSAMAEAVAHLTNGLALLRSLSAGSDRQSRELGLHLALGRALIAAKGFAAPETGRAYARACELCRELGNGSDFLPALYGQWVFHQHAGELANADQVSRELLYLAEERGDTTARVVGHRMAGSTQFQLGKLIESRRHLEAGLALYDRAQDWSSAFVYAFDSRVVCRSWLSHALLALGHPEQAVEWSGAAVAFARELGHPHTSAVCLTLACMFRQLLRDCQSAQAQADAVIALATEQAFPLYRAVGSVVRGWALAERGRVEDGVAEIRRGVDDYAATGAAMWSPYFLGLLAGALGRAGQPEAGLDVLSEALDRLDRTGGRWIEAELHRLRGALLSALPEPRRREAAPCLERGLAVARAQGARMWELRAATSLALLWSAHGQRRDAHELLAPIYAKFVEGFDLPDLKQARVLLDSLTSSPPLRHSDLTPS